MPETRSNSALQAVMAERRDVIKHLRWNARKLNFEAPLSEDAYYELKLLQTDVQDLKDRYIEIKDKLESLDSDNFNDEEHFATLDEFLSVTAIINKHIHNFEKAHGQTDANIAPAPVAQPAPTNSNFRLPEIPLPTFDGNFDKWLDFKAGFSSIIVNNDSVEPSIKYQYLKQALSGEALNRIANSPPGDFKLAWSLLTQRYNSVILIADSHISAIMNPPSLNSKSAQSWRTFIDHQKLNITALESLELDIEVKDLLFMHLIVSRFDANTLRDWERSNSVKDKTSLDNLWTFMEQQHKVSQYVSFGLGSHAQSAQRLVNNQSGNGKPSHNSINNNSRPSTSSTFVKYSGCLFCNDTNHNVFRCNTFLNMAPTARLNAVQQKNLCRNCLRPFSKDHQCFGACRDCGKAHHSLLHFNNSKSSPTVGKNTSSNNAHTRKPNRQQASKSSSNCCCSESKQSDIPSPAVFTPSLTRPVSQASSISVSDTSSVTTVVTPTSSTSSQAISNSNCAHSNSPSLLQRVNIMPTAQLHILSKNNQVISCRALLDTGSDACFISKALASQLDLDSVYSNNTIHTVSGTSSAPVCTAAVLIHSPDRTWSKEVSCILTEKITPSIPPFGLNLQNFNIPPNVKLADPEFHVSKGVDLLLSVAIYSSIQACGQIQLADECTLQNTKLGWVVWGAITPNILNSCEQPVSSNCVSTHDISRQLEKFWKIEEVLPKDSVTKEQHQIEKHYLDNVQRGQDGRFSVALPKKDNFDLLGQSRHQALVRFHSLEKRLATNAELRSQYVAFMDEYESLGHMSPVPDSQPYEKCFHIPHHPVFKPDSTTTKLRVVFDASAKSNTGISLNEALHVGHTVQPELFDIVLRFRTHRVAFIADITKMYRQILVHPEDRNLQRIFWRSNVNDPIQEYVLNTVSYGTSPAAFLATRTLNHLADIDCEPNSPVANAIKNDFYVDDFISGCSTVEQAIDLLRQIRDTLSNGGFELRKWLSNSNEVLNSIPEHLVETVSSFHSFFRPMAWRRTLASLLHYHQFAILLVFIVIFISSFYLEFLVYLVIGLSAYFD
ncbi:uncharacterized protein LOC120355056 isoform X4 [Nilaparvata lugens]|uniref:uncharacterized protein LOC120355056 isoform X3 n=1 Tax=Nilaparvata lugens TaxID=108931 RepID=UPI00193DA03D|nr:uncharacterized protein LOC120355056 isoform X3 [Nilaparvata lugens]XP_039299279.1 uncharacterized protein LOC120355056 isoform X4 [Nilaparvata lugens]